MNPYLSFSIAMCAVVIIALAGTAYLSIYFNRRSKKDMEASLEPLSNVIDGMIEVEEGMVSGRYQGQLAEGKVSTMPGGMSRIFLISVVEGAGGQPWEWTLTRSKEPGGPDEARFKVDVPGVTDQIEPSLMELKNDPDLHGIWYRIDYDPASGLLKMTRPMRVRRDIPSADAFRRYLDALIGAAAANRAAQGPDSGQV
jgi:hypothetical protein